MKSMIFEPLFTSTYYLSPLWTWMHCKKMSRNLRIYRKRLPRHSAEHSSCGKLSHWATKLLKKTGMYVSIEDSSYMHNTSLMHPLKHKCLRSVRDVSIFWNSLKSSMMMPSSRLILRIPRINKHGKLYRIAMKVNSWRCYDRVPRIKRVNWESFEKKLANAEICRLR